MWIRKSLDRAHVASGSHRVLQLVLFRFLLRIFAILFAGIVCGREWEMEDFVIGDGCAHAEKNSVFRTQHIETE